LSFQPFYQDLAPWQNVEQLRVAGFQMLMVTSLTPFMCVAVFTVVLL
jgi:hypothetical protein